MNTGDECWLEDGRKAYFAGEIDNQKFVRVAMHMDDEDFGYEEWPSDKLTPVTRIFPIEPEYIFGDKRKAAEERLSKLREEESGVRASVMSLRGELKELENEKAKYPDISTALDFFSGKITHVVETSPYSRFKILELTDFIGDRDFNGRSDGLRLVSLFGTDTSGKTCWRRNQYRDGSGSSWTEFEPCHSLDEAKMKVCEAFGALIHEWRMERKSIGLIGDISSKHDFLELPKDVADALTELRAKSKAERIDKLRAQITEIEAQQ